MNNFKFKILFMVETVTLAHITRSIALANTLDSNRFEVYFAAQYVPSWIMADLSKFKFIPLTTSVSSRSFLDCLSRGTLPFTVEILQKQIAEDLEIIASIRPDYICGDMRLSLVISSQIAKVKFANITNSTWSSFTKQPVIIPEIPLTRLVGAKLGSLLFKITKSILFRSYAGSFNTLAKKYKLKKFNSLLDIYTFGDLTFYLDIPNLVKSSEKVSSNCIGPVFFSANTEIPRDLEISIKLESIPKNKPWIFLSLGSSGAGECLPLLLSALRQLDIVLIVSTSNDSKQNLELAYNQFAFEFLPLDQVIPLCKLVICQGGSPLGYTALRSGIPFLAVPSNLDQFQFTQAIIDKGAALSIRPSYICNGNQLAQAKIIELVQILINGEQFKLNAEKIQSEILSFQGINLFAERLSLELRTV